MSTLVSSAATIAEWQSILDRIDESVARALAETDRHEQALAGSREDARFEFPGTDAIQERLAGLESRFAKARAAAAEIESLLVRDEREVAAWCDAANAARQRLLAAERL